MRTDIARLCSGYFLSKLKDAKTMYGGALPRQGFIGKLPLNVISPPIHVLSPSWAKALQVERQCYHQTTLQVRLLAIYLMLTSDGLLLECLSKNCFSATVLAASLCKKVEKQRTRCCH